jgi:2-polyprenyl-3-methyl-5-hydroxy-6-metoxy-1,4-benzoquinol methylase
MNEYNREARGRKSAWGGDPMNGLERLGTWLSMWQIQRVVGRMADKDVADFGCGQRGGVSFGQASIAKSLTLVDFSLAPELKAAPRVHAIEGVLPAVLEQVPDSSMDIVICNNVVEHVWDRARLVAHIRRVLRADGTAFINVPSWRGKWFLETAAFRLKITPRSEINDHKAYFNRRELWLLLIAGGFLPSEVECVSHKFGLNTYAVCRSGR